MVKKRLTFAVDEHGNRLGEAHHHAKLTDKEVEEIRDVYENGGMGYKRLAKAYKVSRELIREIVQYRRRATTPAGYKTIIIESSATWAVRPDWGPRMDLSGRVPPPEKDFMFEDEDLFTS